MKGLRGFYDLLTGDEAQLLEMLPAFVGQLPAGHQLRLEELHELMEGSTVLGPPDPPVWLRRLFVAVELQLAGQELPHVSAELLAALSWCLTRYAPDNPGGPLALPETERRDCYVHATVDELEARDMAAVAQLRHGVLVAARSLAERRQRLPTGIVGALVDYCAWAAPEDRYPDPREAAYDVAATYTLFLARAQRGGRIEAALRAMVSHPTPETT